MGLEEICHGVSIAMGSIAEEIASGELPEGATPLAEMLQDLRLASRSIKEAEEVLSAELHARLGQEDSKSVVLSDGGRVTSVNVRRRKKIDREGMVAFVREYARMNPLDSETGEIMEEERKFQDLLFRCFRQEPRWAKLNELGMTDEDYCEIENSGMVRIT